MDDEGPDRETASWTRCGVGPRLPFMSGRVTSTETGENCFVQGRNYGNPRRTSPVFTVAVASSGKGGARDRPNGGGGKGHRRVGDQKATWRTMLWSRQSAIDCTEPFSVWPSLRSLAASISWLPSD